MNKISFVIPCYNEEESIEFLLNNVEEIMQNQLPNIKYNYIFIDDGSKDGTLEVIKKLAKKNKKIRYISFSRNFGKEAAMLAGIQNADGEYISILDADMQDPPSLIPQMYSLINNDKYDCVCTRRVTRQGEPRIRSLFAKLFYLIMNHIGMVKLEDGSRDFLMMNRYVAESILSVGDYVRFFKGLFVWVGFRRKWLEYENINRFAGQTKWSFWSLTKYALTAISSFTVQPLIWPLFLGILLGIIGIITSFVKIEIGIMLVLFSLHMIFMGIFGYYVATIFLETKKRPQYLIKETNVKK